MAGVVRIGMQYMIEQDPLEPDEARNLAHALGLHDGAAQQLLRLADEAEARQWDYDVARLGPPQPREPYCIHPGGEKQPASACGVCKDSKRLANWRNGWAAFFRANPNDPRNPALKEKTDGH